MEPRSSTAQYVLTSFWTPSAPGALGPYRLRLENRSDSLLERFSIGLSGVVFLPPEGPIGNAQLVTRTSNYAELAPPAGFELAPGASWSIDIPKLLFPLRHWTDGIAAAFLIRGGEATPIAVTPPDLAGTSPCRRGVQRLASGAAPEISVVPWPKQVDVSGRRTAPSGLSPEAGAVADSFAELTSLLFPGEGLARAAHEGGLPVMLAADPELEPEAYRISFASHGVKVEAAGATGSLYGLITLAQIVRGARQHPDRYVFPQHGHIHDAPQMGFRGCHLDVARRFYGVGEIRRFLALLAWNKLNRFHWHLSDDEGWRIEIDAYPRLVSLGAWRGYDLPLPPLLGDGPEKSGGFYRKADVRALVGLADRFGIEVIPEIDVPGHSFALLTALPELVDAGDNGIYRSIQSFPNNCLNPAVEATHPVLETIFSELIDLFPSRYVHVGADEVPDAAWSSSPLARKMATALGGGVVELQAALLRRLQSFLTARGRITGAWEEAAHGGGIDTASCYLVGWTTVAAARKAAANGYKVVIAPGQAYYLDMALSPEWAEPGAGWAGSSSIEATYAFDPGAGWTEAERANVLGVQACIWSEPMRERAVFDRLVFPRLSAIAETGWTAPQHKDFSRFAALAGLLPSLYGCRETD